MSEVCGNSIFFSLTIQSHFHKFDAFITNIVLDEPTCTSFLLS